MKKYIELDKVLEKAYWHGRMPDFDNPYPDGVEAVDVSDIDDIPTVNALVLPCEVGDTVYRLFWSQGGKKRWNFHIAEQRIKNLHDIVDCIEGLGKTMFLTKEEAEAALERERK